VDASQGRKQVDEEKSAQVQSGLVNEAATQQLR